MHSSPETISNKHAEHPLLCRAANNQRLKLTSKLPGRPGGRGDSAWALPYPRRLPRTPSLHPGPSFAQST